MASDDGTRSENRKVREMASPRLVRGLSLHKSPSRKLSSRAASLGSTDGFSKIVSQASPDVRVGKKMNPEHTRTKSRQNKELNSQRNNLPELNEFKDRMDILSRVSSPKQMVMSSKMRSKNGTSLLPLVSAQGSRAT